MKPDMILQSDVLDILFENKNKAYGAYALRKNYDNRMLLSLGGTILLVALFVALQYIKPVQPDQQIFLPPDTDLTTVVLDPEKPKEPPREEKATVQKKERTITNSVPVIKPNVETNVPTTDEADKNRIGKVPSDGDDPDGRIQQPSGDKGPETTGPPASPPAFDTTTIRHFVDIMPAFNGDFKKYMLKNLRQPGDLEEGQRIQVRVRFVVTREGDINDVEVVQSGRADLDQEVLRVVRRMPKWRPGTQSGRHVPVYFNLPVTFVNDGE